MQTANMALLRMRQFILFVTRFGNLLTAQKCCDISQDDKSSISLFHFNIADFLILNRAVLYIAGI